MKTVRIIGSKGNMGREHMAAYKSMGVKVIDVGTPDIVSVASPDHTHAAYVAEALRNGSHVFCEKPLCRRQDELADVAALAIKNSLYVRQNFPLRYQYIFRQMKESVPKFGDIYRIEASYNWGRTHKLNESWRSEDPEYSLVFGGMIHMLDLAHWLTGQQVQVLSVASCNKSAPDFPGPDTVVALCEMEGGGIATFTVDGGSGVDGHNHRLTVHGSKGGWTVVNREKTDKQKAVEDFVGFVRDRKAPLMDASEIHAIKTALAIEGMLAERGKD